MSRFAITIVTLLLPAIMLPVSITGVHAAAGDIKRGQEIARIHCARCHVVGAFNRMGGISSTPSFYLLVRAFKDWRQRFETFYARRPHPAFISITGIGRKREDLPANAHPIELPEQAVQDVIAYAQTLRKPVQTAPK